MRVQVRINQYPCLGLAKLLGSTVGDKLVLVSFFLFNKDLLYSIFKSCETNSTKNVQSHSRATNPSPTTGNFAERRRLMRKQPRSVPDSRLVSQLDPTKKKARLSQIGVFSGIFPIPLTADIKNQLLRALKQIHETQAIS